MSAIEAAAGHRPPTPLLIFPFNGNALEAIDCLGDAFVLVGFIDDTPGKQGLGPLSVPILGRDALAKWPQARVLAVPGSATSYLGRRAAISSLQVPDSRFVTVVHPTARVSPLARIGRNVLVMAGAVVTSNAVIGDHVCILPNTVIHHDVTVGDWTLIGSNVTVAGGTAIGENCYIGSASSIMNGLEVGDRSLIGLGSNVIRSCPVDSRLAGNPARSLD
ncbi:MAG: acetyltransferase, partial [Pseudomonadota bacterium]|nr:acetyltransferase [Pseudomonadota bacterium]